MSRIINFFTFQSPTFKSVFNEGQRRFVMVVSLIAPFLIAYIWFYDSGDLFVASPIFYLIFHVICLVYIWIREGQGKVREGGNAGKSLWNLAKFVILSFIIVAACGISYQEYNKMQKEKKIEEDKVVVLENTEKFVSCISSENIDCITELLAGNKKNDIRDRMLNSFKDCDFKSFDLIDPYVEEITNYYILRGKIEYFIKCSNNKSFEKIVNNITVEYRFGILDIKIGE